jgi:hypothetical protein
MLIKNTLKVPFLLMTLLGLASAEETGSSLEIFVDHYEDANLVESEATGFAWRAQWSKSISTTLDHSFDAVSGATRTLGKNLDGESGATFGTPEYPSEAPAYLNGLEEIWYHINGATGATTDEVRMADGLRVEYNKQGRVAGFGINTSQERDYSSYSFNTNLSWDFFERNFTLGMSHAQFFEDFHPIAAFVVQNQGEKRISSSVINFAQTLSPRTLLSGSAGYTQSWGYLGHPYTPIVLITGELLPESLPSSKNSMAIATQIVQGFYLGEYLSTARLKYRYYTDSWGLKANTTELQLSRYLAEWISMRLRLRHHIQFANDFAQSSFTGSEPYRTADIRFYSFQSYLSGIQFSGLFPESWESAWLPKEWQIKWDHLWRNTQGNLNLYQIYATDEYYSQDEFMASLKYLF